MPNYTKLAATALRLITNSGRYVTLQKLDRTAADTDQPWRGTEDETVEIQVPAAFTETMAPAEGLIRTEEADVWIPAVAGQDITTFEYLIDGGQKKKIEEVMPIKPGTVVVAYGLKLER